LNYINKYKVLNFQEHKNKIIDLIFKIPRTPLKDKNESIFHTDWEIPQSMQRDYLEYFKKNIMEDFFNDFNLKHKFKKIKIDNIWFQVYAEGDWHGPHTHPETNFTNVFYLQLPSKSLKTNILNNNIDVSEGDILTFPAFLRHESPKNQTNQFKIVISFNTSIIE